MIMLYTNNGIWAMAMILNPRMCLLLICLVFHHEKSAAPTRPESITTNAMGFVNWTSIAVEIIQIMLFKFGVSMYVNQKLNVIHIAAVTKAKCGKIDRLKKT